MEATWSSQTHRATQVETNPCGPSTRPSSRTLSKQLPADTARTCGACAHPDTLSAGVCGHTAVTTGRGQSTRARPSLGAPTTVGLGAAHFPELGGLQQTL